MKDFDLLFGLELLEKMVTPPPSDDMLDGTIVRRIQDFLASKPTDVVVVWNFYKEMLDLIVHGSLGSGFIVRIFDLEAFLKAPVGAYAQADGSINQAPWRKTLGA